MGQSTPTTTIALDVFLERYSQFRSELHPREQRWFDELVCRARRHSSAINRRPHLDFERPVMLAMMMEGMRELEAVQDEVRTLRRELERIGALERRVPAPDPLAFARSGQTVLVEA